jgi:hypothetical protein
VREVIKSRKRLLYWLFVGPKNEVTNLRFPVHTVDITIPEEGNIANDDLSYAELIKSIDEGSIHIPEFQREFVWNEQKILDLLDSIYKKYPIGSLIFWVTNEDFHWSLVKPSSNTILPNYAPKCLERWISRTNCYCRQNQAISICFRPEFRAVAGVIVRNSAQKHRH